MIQKIVTVKNPVLRQKSKSVVEFDKKIGAIIQDLKDTLIIQKDPIGVGLAAPQIGKNLQMFAIKPKDKISIIINPQIVYLEDTKTKNPNWRNFLHCFTDSVIQDAATAFTSG